MSRLWSAAVFGITLLSSAARFVPPEERVVKKVIGIHSQPVRHWVGDGFPVRSLFSYSEYGKVLSPFLLLDHAGPAAFTPTEGRRGVGEHPHRGFETVTIVYQGELEHRDSTGGGGLIGAGDVQWMTAGAGILHEEFHSEHFTNSGGALEMVQLWVNLPAKDKMTPPGYQAIVAADIPQVPLPDDAGEVRVIAGAYEGRKGPAHTYTPMNVWDLRLRQGGIAQLDQPDGWNTAVVVLHGTVLVNGDAILREAQMVVLDRDGSGVDIEAHNDAVVLLLAGEPIDDPIVGYGPFVMNTHEEIEQAMRDVQSGRFGEVNATA